MYKSSVVECEAAYRKGGLGKKIRANWFVQAWFEVVITKEESSESLKSHVVSYSRSRFKNQALVPLIQESFLSHF